MTSLVSSQFHYIFPLFALVPMNEFTNCVQCMLLANVFWWWCLSHVFLDLRSHFNNVTFCWYIILITWRLFISYSSYFQKNKNIILRYELNVAKNKNKYILKFKPHVKSKLSKTQWLWISRESRISVEVRESWFVLCLYVFSIDNATLPYIIFI